MPASQTRLKVLHLCRWYPNRYDPMLGLFTQRHAEASALYVDASVVYTHLVSGEKLKSTYEIEVEELNGVRTAKVYYQPPRNKILFWSQIVRFWRFVKANRIGIGAVSESIQNFDLVHVHVLTRLGVIALYYKWRFGIPFVITEHWTRYLDLTQRFTGFFRKLTTRLVVKRAAVVTAVSNDLIKAMQRHKLRNKDYRLIDNVVDPVFFDVAFPEKMTNERELVHVSCFADDQKNISGLLRVVKSLSEKHSDFHFTLVGEGEDFAFLKSEAERLNIPQQRILFTGLLEGKPLAEAMAKADALVLFSRYENMPVVINESFVLGVPVFSTDVGGISEMINSQNGYLVPEGDEPGLVKALNDFLDNKLSFNDGIIREYARQRFSQQAIGKNLFSLYQQALLK